MNRLIFPEIFKGKITAFFTGKDPGAEVPDISRTLKIQRECIYLPVQKHTDKVQILGSDHEPKIADAVITTENGVLIGVRVADCVPVLLWDRARGVIGAVHAGWRGTAAGILKKTLLEMSGRFFCDPKDILVAIGPGIKWCCYGVDHDVVHAVRQATGEGDYVLEKGGKYCLDLPSANKYQAVSAGIPEPNIWISEDCTFCNPGRYFSYRYARGATGRQGGFIGFI